MTRNGTTTRASDSRIRISRLPYTRSAIPAATGLSVSQRPSTTYDSAFNGPRVHLWPACHTWSLASLRSSPWLCPVVAFSCMAMKTWYGMGMPLSIGYNPTHNYWMHSPKTDPASARVRYGRQIKRTPTDAEPSLCGSQFRGLKNETACHPHWPIGVIGVSRPP
jgi:hypothetical protein